MNPEIVRARMTAIQRYADRSSKARLVCALRVELLAAIAIGRCEEPQRCASEALRTADGQITRECA